MKIYMFAKCFKINPFKTLYYSILLGGRQFYRLPVIIGWNVQLTGMSRIIFPHNVRLTVGLYKGFLNDGELTKLRIKGQMIIKGNVNIARGFKIDVHDEGVLLFNGKWECTGHGYLVCSNDISFGDNVLVSWGFSCLDYDFHHIINDKGDKVVNIGAVRVSDNVWIGKDVTILKNTLIEKNSVIGANTLVSGKHRENIILSNLKSTAHTRKIKGWIR